MHDKYGYRVMWSEEDQKYVGLVAKFPSISWLSKSQDGAFKGIRTLTKEIIADMKQQGEPVPEPLASKSFSGKFMIV
jgi:predicted RNase H-like HicB family nuclease